MMTMNPDSPVIDVRSLGVRYGRHEALRDVSFTIAAGEVYALLGRNGAGKSSLVRCLLGHQKPSRGRAALFGRDSWKHRKPLMARLGVVPEEPDAPPGLTAVQLSRFCAALYPRWDGDGLRARLERFEVPLDRAFGKLSKGQKGQVMLALALAPSPELLVLDDPTLGLDVVARKAIFEEVVGELADRGVTVFVTSHDLPGIERIASRVGFLQGGRVSIDEDLEELKGRFRRVVWMGEAGDGPAVDESRPGTRALREMEPITVERQGRGWQAVVARFEDSGLEELRKSPGVHSAEAEGVSLEDILVAVAGEPGGTP